MHLAHPLSWYVALLLAAAIGVASWLEYRRPLAPLTRAQRGVLVALRVAMLAALVLFLFRPVAMLPPASARDAVVPILVDTSRSMRLADADGQTRLARAASLLKNELGEPLSSKLSTEIYSVGDTLAAAKPDERAAQARRTDLAGALAAIRERYRGQRVAGVVLLSDGADTGGWGRPSGPGGDGLVGGPPVYAVGI